MAAEVVSEWRIAHTTTTTTTTTNSHRGARSTQRPIISEQIGKSRGLRTFFRCARSVVGSSALDDGDDLKPRHASGFHTHHTTARHKPHEPKEERVISLENRFKGEDRQTGRQTTRQAGRQTTRQATRQTTRQTTRLTTRLRICLRRRLPLKGRS